jgi:hypothetical protein
METALYVLVLSLGVVPASNLPAQTTASGGLSGVVLDPTHAVVPDADVEITDNAKGTTQSTKTDREGVYRFFFLAPGRYTLTVGHPGFREEKRTVNVLQGPPVSVNLTLTVTTASTNITVTDEAPLLQAENGDVAATMNQTQVAEVPNPGNDLTYTVQTAPGVVMNTEGQGGAYFSVLGMPGNSYHFTMDGLNGTDNANGLPFTSSFSLLMGQNQVQEATLVSTGYSGQFGGAAGGNVNYTTKSGSNQFHGNAQYYWNGRILNANDWFSNTFELQRPFDNANQWAGSFGGPLKKNKLFFFFDTEGLRVLIPVQLFVTVPSPKFEAATQAHIDDLFGATSASHFFYKKIFDVYRAAPGANTAEAGVPGDPLGGCGTNFTLLGEGVPCADTFFTFAGRPSQDTLTAARVDWTLGRNDRAFLRLRYDGGRSALITDPISPAFDVDYDVRWWQGQIIETHTFGSSAASQFSVARSYNSYDYSFKDVSKALEMFPTVLNFSLFQFNPLGNPYIGLGFSRNYPQYQLSEDLVKTRGNHKLGFGASFERIHWTLAAYEPFTVGSLNVQTLDAFYQGGFDPASPDANFTQLNQNFPSTKAQRMAFYNLALYGQDEWHAQPNLTLTFALRAEHQSNPTCESRCFVRMAGSFESVSHDPAQPYNQALFVNQRQALAATDSIVWSPRFSFAWQPFGGTHNAVLRGGAGIFYDPVPGYLAQALSTNPPVLNAYSIHGYNLTPGEDNSLFTAAKNSNQEFMEGFPIGKTLSDFKQLDPNFTPPSITVPGGRTRTPQYQKWSLELQHAFGAATSLNVGYFGHHGIHELVLDPNVNAFGFGSLPAGLCESPPVPPCADARFGGVTEIRSEAVSNYNGMVVSFRHRFQHWGQGLFQANYTYGHAIDEVSNGGLFTFTINSSSSPADPNYLRSAYGNAEYDVRHSLNANYVWEVPVKAALGGHGPDFLVKGWQVSGTLFVRTGFPYTVFDYAKSGQLTANNYFGTVYAVPAGPIGSDLDCGKGAALPAAPHPCQVLQVLPKGDPNPQARFVQAGCETGFNTGTLPGPTGPCDGQSVSFVQGRNRFRGPGYFNSDFTIVKNTKIPGWENAELGIGFQFFNVFNYPNFGIPDHSTSLASFGMIGYTNQPPTSLLGSGLGGDTVARMIQLKVQLQF